MIYLYIGLIICFLVMGLHIWEVISFFVSNNAAKKKGTISQNFASFVQAEEVWADNRYIRYDSVFEIIFHGKIFRMAIMLIFMWGMVAVFIPVDILVDRHQNRKLEMERKVGLISKYL